MAARADTRQTSFPKSPSESRTPNYSDLLEVYGLRFVRGAKPAGNWKLERRPDQTDEQKRNLERWLAPSPIQ
jgi:hypothetical protein